MVVILSFYDHWMARYLTKTSKSAFYIYDTAPFDVLLNISPSNDHRRLYHSSFESSHQDESNGGNFILLQSLDGEIFSKTSKIGIYKYKKCRFLTFRQISGHPVITEGWSYHHSIRLDETIRMSYGTAFCDHWTVRYLAKRQMAQFRKYKNADFDISSNIWPSRDRGRTNLPPFDSS